MDEDEKEMLSEARARLANTKGKKAKRKAREKQLEEARRLASLQKRRELKAAGIETVKRAKRIQGIDYNAEIPFERKPAPGFYDTTEERKAQEDPFNEETFKPATLAELEGPRKKDLEEQLMKQDVKRQRIFERHDTPAAVQQVNALNDPSTIRRRSKLMLPAPQVSERELEDIAKMSGAAAMELDGEGDTPGGALLATYGQTPSRFTPAATPMRTPQVGGHDVILQEAQNLRKLQTGQTPLLGGENPTLAGSDFSGITPQRTMAATPNPIAATPGATPSRGGGPGATPSTVAGTPGRGYGGGVAATPLRDSLNINDQDAFLMDDARGAKARATLARSELRESLRTLPAPTNEYQIVVPELPEEDDMTDGPGMEEDANDVLEREAAAIAAEEAAAALRRSKVVQRNLPRPPAESTGPAAASAGGMDATAAEKMIATELAAVLEHDAAAYPVKKEKRPRPVPSIPRVEVEEMEFAAELIAREARAVKSAMGHDDADEEDYMQASVAVRGDWIIQAETGKAIPKRSAKPADRVAAAAAEHERLRAEMERDAKRAAKLEHKVGLLTAGLQKRSGELAAKLTELAQQLATAEEEHASYLVLHDQEQRAAPARMEQLMELTKAAAERERGLQAAYQSRSEELSALRAS